MKRGRPSADDKLRVISLTGARITPPTGLDEEELLEWHAIVESLPADYFRPADVPLLAAFCTAAVIYRGLRQQIRENGLTYRNDKGNICCNPAVSLMSQQGSTMAHMAVKLRLCPSSRYSDKKANGLHEGPAKATRPWDTDPPQYSALD